MSNRAMSEKTWSGGCLCGAVRYEAKGDGRDLCFCHCESCRRATGAVMVAWATFDRARFAVTRGQLAEYRSSAEVLRGFCAACGTSLTYCHEKRGHEIDIALATLDTPAALRPAAHIWVKDKLPWVALTDGLPEYETVRRAELEASTWLGPKLPRR
jgi:hypothetical protein